MVGRIFKKSKIALSLISAIFININEDDQKNIVAKAAILALSSFLNLDLLPRCRFVLS